MDAVAGWCGDGCCYGVLVPTLREQADDVLSWGPYFGPGGVHGVEEQPVLIAPLQDQRLAADGGDAVPLDTHTHTHTHVKEYPGVYKCRTLVSPW